MSSLFKYSIAFSLFSLISTLSLAQTGNDDLPSEQVEVIKDFEAKLIETEKLLIDPSLPPLDTNQRKLIYQVPSKTSEVEYLPPKIRPIAMKADPVPESYNGFIKLGYGIPSSPYAELSYNKTDPEKYNFGGYLKHHSANYNNLENQRFSETGVNLTGTYYFDQGYAVDGKIGFTADEVHFYGYDHKVDLYNREDIRQQFNTFEFSGNLFNGKQTVGDINYDAGFDLYNLSDNYASDELGFALNLGMSKWFNDQHQVKIALITDFTNFTDTAKQTLNNIFFQPNFTLHGDLFKVKFGVNLAAHKDDFSLFPDVEASANIVGNKLAAFAGAQGGLNKNNYKNLSDYNPFMSSRFQLRNTEFNHFYGGIRGNLRIVDYRAQVGLKKTKNLPLYLTNPNDTIRFNVLYDTVDIWNIQGTLNAYPIKNLMVTVTLGQNFYSLDNEEKAWHLPALEFNAGARYTTLEDKLTLKAELFVENGVPYKDLRGNVDNLNGLFDLSLGAEYRINKNFGLFFDVNNLLSNKRERWLRYPTYGLNILGGITAKF